MESKKELFEEGNIREDYIEELICTGLGRNLHTNKPEFLFYCKLNIDSETLKEDHWILILNPKADCDM